MFDGFGRKIDYMRLSVTENCNLRCIYCMPEKETQEKVRENLSLEEIINICRAGAELGIRNVRITGGEPLVREDCPEIIGEIGKIPGIERVMMTTNGILLKDKMDELLKNGLGYVNISLDSLDREKYRKITGKDALDKVFSSIECALDKNLHVKINTLIIKNMNEDEIVPMAELAKDDPIDIRFIEMMPMGYGKDFEGVSGSQVMDILRSEFGEGIQEQNVTGSGPAEYVRFKNFKGRIGFINARSSMFCAGCNKIRVTSDGFLKPCLCYGDGVNLKDVLAGKRNDVLIDAVRDGIMAKPAKHSFENIENITETRAMINIGG